MRAVVFDLDSTLADTRHRQWMIKVKPERTDWEAYSLACVDDTPIAGAVRLAEVLAESLLIIIVSGRSGVAREATLAWLNRHSVPHHRVIMRPEGDYTPNPIFKTAVVTMLREEGYEIELLADDFDAVSAAMGERHPDIPVLLVNPGYHGEGGA